MFRSLLVTSCLFISTSSVISEDWTRFRGPNGSGVISDAHLPDTWNDDSYRWKIDLPGIGYGSAIGFGQSIFLLTADPDSHERRVVSLNTESGKVNWKRGYAGKTVKLHAKNSYASGTPCCDARAVYAVWADYEHTRVVALSHDGKPLWEKDLGTWIGDHGYGASPMIVGDLLVIFNEQQKDQLNPGEVAGQSQMIALRCDSGRVVWVTDLSTTRPSYGTPCIFQDAVGKPQLIDCNTGDGFFGLEPESGKLLWKLPVFEARCVSSPIVAGNLLIGTAGSGGGGNHLVAVRPGEQPEMIFRVDKQAPYVPTPVYKDEMLFCVADRGVAGCFDAKTGAEIWTERLGGNFYSSPIIVGERLLCVSLEGTAYVLKATREGGLIGKVELGGGAEATPSFVGGYLLFRYGNQLAALNCKSPI